MPEPKAAFIDPAAALAALTPMMVELDGDGPSPPHQLELEPEELPVAKLKLNAKTPSVGLDPGAPPILGGGAGEYHYTNALDEIWPEFDTPEERTVARVKVVFAEVKEQARKVFLLAQQVLDQIPVWQVKDPERERFNKDMTQYIKRLQTYEGALQELAPADPIPDEVYVGLIKRRSGAGPVPDVIMHLHFADQLGILSDHAETMNEGFVARVIDGLAAVDGQFDKMKDKFDDAQEEIKDGVENTAQELGQGIRRTLLIVGGVLLGSIVVIGGTVALAAGAVGKARESGGGDDGAA